MNTLIPAKKKGESESKIQWGFEKGDISKYSWFAEEILQEANLGEKAEWNNFEAWTNIICNI